MSEKSLITRISFLLDKNPIDLPVFNPIALKLQQLVTRAEYDAKQIQTLISQDPALTAEILKLANSPLYGGLTQISSLQQAVTRLGSEEIVRLALTTASGAYYKPKNKKLLKKFAALWQRAAISAISSKWLADRAGFRDQGHIAYVCGLIHDIGELYTISALDTLQSTIDSLVIPESVYEEIVTTTHEEQGRRLLNLWNLPEVYQEIAGNHHRTEFDESSIIPAIISVADKICDIYGIGKEPDDSISLSASDEAFVLGLTDLDFAELEVKVEDILEASAVK